MDEILKQILSELKDLRQGQETLISRVGNLEQGQTELRQGQETLISRVGNLEQGQEAQGRELKELRQGQETLISRVGNLEQGQEAQGHELKELRQGQEAQGRELKGLRKDLTKLAIHVEDEITDKIRSLYDARELMLDSLARIEARLDRQDERLDRQEILTLNKKRR